MSITREDGSRVQLDIEVDFSKFPHQENRQQTMSQLKNNYSKNYERIDDALQKEKELRDKIRNEKINFRNSEIKKMKNKRRIAVFLWGGAIALLTTIITPLIISTLIVSLITMYYIATITEESITAITKYECDKEKLAEREIVRMYTELLYNVDIYPFLGIPSDIKCDKNGLPYGKESSSNSVKPYGSLTRYITSLSGSRYHRTRGCSGAYTPIHIYPLALNDYYMNWRVYTPCRVCGIGDTIIVPQWYIYYKKVIDIANKYEIKINYTNNYKKEE